jgi:hypothetical protein
MQPGHGAYNNKMGHASPLLCFWINQRSKLSIIIGRLLSQIEYGQNGSWNVCEWRE